MDRRDKLKDSLLSFFHNLFDLLVVNWLWLLCSLPIVTVGPATCALYTVTLKLARDEPVKPAKDFLCGFKNNLKSGFLLGLAVIVLLVVVAGDAYFALLQTGWIRNMYLVLAVILGIVWLILISYAFALQAMFDSTLNVQILNAFKLAVIAPGRTIGLWVVLLLPVIIFLVLPPVALRMLGFLYLAVGISAPVYIASRIQRKIFDRVNGSSVVDMPPTSEE